MLVGIYRQDPQDHCILNFLILQVFHFKYQDWIKSSRLLKLTLFSNLFNM